MIAFQIVQLIEVDALRDGHVEQEAIDRDIVDL